MTQSVEHLTSTEGMFTVHEFEPYIRLAAISLPAQSLVQILCPPLSAPLSLALSHRLKFFFFFKEVHDQEDVATIIRICVPNNRAPKYMKQKLTELKGKTDNSIVIIEGLNTSFLGRLGGSVG